MAAEAPGTQQLEDGDACHETRWYKWRGMSVTQQWQKLKALVQGGSEFWYWLLRRLALSNRG